MKKTKYAVSDESRFAAKLATLITYEMLAIRDFMRVSLLQGKREQYWPCRSLVESLTLKVRTLRQLDSRHYATVKSQLRRSGFTLGVTAMNEYVNLRNGALYYVDGKVTTMPKRLRLTGADGHNVSVSPATFADEYFEISALSECPGSTLRLLLTEAVPTWLRLRAEAELARRCDTPCLRLHHRGI